MTDKIKIDIDFQKIYRNVVNYFSRLAQDMIIAWSALGLGLILIIVGIIVI